MRALGRSWGTLQGGGRDSAGAIRALDEASPPPLCRRVRSLDVDDGGTDAADADDGAFSALGRDRLSVDQMRWGVDEVTLADLDQPRCPQGRIRPSSLRW
jgi:hypothetical protein